MHQENKLQTSSDNIFSCKDLDLNGNQSSKHARLLAKTQPAICKRV